MNTVMKLLFNWTKIISVFGMRPVGFFRSFHDQHDPDSFSFKSNDLYATGRMTDEPVEEIALPV